MRIEKNISEEGKSLVNRLRGENAEEMAENSYLLAASLEEMFGSGQYFQGRAQIESLLTAVEATKDARDNLLELEESRAGFIDTSSLSKRQAQSELVRNAVASTLMVYWCAHGLTGISRTEAARQVFQASITRSKVQNWNSFKQILARECQRYLPN